MNYPAISQSILQLQATEEAKLFLLGVFFALGVRVFRALVVWAKRASSTYFD